ncbi:MAG: FKBP-type peptidyl-prolyl cis-trans isomerase [Fibromonadaceae bacterium]|jgi:FKBP-type peptidyl-prolyl cis-trans isomerase|nr:FKBP-type peptidyl-prolyl cis-trans isomerase [Fibromonadaceae bacterium]
MKKSLLLSAIAACAIFVSCDLNANKETLSKKEAFESPKGKQSYAFGANMGMAIKRVDADLLNYDLVIQGIRDQLDTTKPALMDDNEIMAALQQLAQQVHRADMLRDSILMEERKAQTAENLAIQNSFLEKNKSEAGVISTESGLQYIVLTQGSGKLAKEGDNLSVHYTGTFLDGTKFDSSVDRNLPLSVSLGTTRLISGWVEMLYLMKKGDRVKVWVPSNLGYGEVGNQVVPGNSLLVFEMELLAINE